MTDILDIIFRRRSIRRYTDQPLDEATLTQLLRAAMAAPSAVNSQPWEFVVVTDEELLRQLRSRLFFGRYRAPAAIVVCGSPEKAHNTAGRVFWVQDCSAAAENLMIAAAGLGLGTVWIGVYPMKPVMNAVARIVGLPEEVIPLAVIYVGHPAENKPPRTRYDEYLVHWQRYQPRRRRSIIKNAKFTE